MLRSMYSGISGMKNFQTKLDVIGNNIANVNTYGFKKGRTTFKDLMSQQVAGASGPSLTNSGVNPQQVGLGSTLSTIDTIHTTGSLQTTGRTLDLALAGDGFFPVATIKNPGSVSLDAGTAFGNNRIAGNINDAVDLNYTRAGNFYMDDKGYLVTAEGYYLIGETGTKTQGANPQWTDTLSGQAGLIQVPLTAKSFSIGQDGKVTFVSENGNLQVAGQIRIATFSNPGGLEKAGGNLFRESVNSGRIDQNNDGIQLSELLIPGSNGAATIASGALEMSNVDLSEEFTDMIVAQRGFQSNTKIISTSDEILQELVNLKR
ncbi:flagellar basal body rod protein FlgG [Bacillus lacus]|uniref:Flagellar hook protein FlgE n=1 Tax=Metabacillus lacus TaxID=1983721 RepID=A0A7X2IVW9_9BACI|nr:flagellar basal body rod protein FlgG [Metabacillus lacus]MRX70599.1 flagellar basal body rod protein FlgG [Metabacillus lacus]